MTFPANCFTSISLGLVSFLGNLCQEKSSFYFPVPFRMGLEFQLRRKKDIYTSLM